MFQGHQNVHINMKKNIYIFSGIILTILFTICPQKTFAQAKDSLEIYKEQVRYYVLIKSMQQRLTTVTSLYDSVITELDSITKKISASGVQLREDAAYCKIMSTGPFFDNALKKFNEHYKEYSLLQSHSIKLERQRDILSKERTALLKEAEIVLQDAPTSLSPK